MGEGQYSHVKPELSLMSTSIFLSEACICLTTLSFSIALEFIFFYREFDQTVPWSPGLSPDFQHSVGYRSLPTLPCSLLLPLNCDFLGAFPMPVLPCSPCSPHLTEIFKASLNRQYKVALPKILPQLCQCHGICFLGNHVTAQWSHQSSSLSSNSYWRNHSSFSHHFTTGVTKVLGPW